MLRAHPNQDVESAIIRLSDALCTWERSTGIESILIIREKRGYVYRAVNGKPGVPDDLTDEEIIDTILG